MSPIIKPDAGRLGLAHVLREHIADYQKQYRLWPQQRKIVYDLLNCRTPYPDGFLANRNRSVNLADIRQLMTLPDPPDTSVTTVAVMMRKLTGIDITVCPCCKKGKMRLFREIPRGRARPPNPLFYAAA
jgi:hypothetical protein